MTGCTKISPGCKHCYAERMEDVVRLAKKADRPNVGVTFTFCHFLAVDDAKNMDRVLEMARPYLTMVTINGTSGFDPKNFGRWIQVLGQGSFDVARVLKTLRKLDYRGPIGILNHTDADADALTGPTSAPWLDSNAWYVRLARTLLSPEAMWLAFEPPEVGRPAPAPAYVQAIADTEAFGARWLVSLVPHLRRGLQLRGQLVHLTRELGCRLPPPVTAGLWQWSTRLKESKQRKP